MDYQVYEHYESEVQTIATAAPDTLTDALLLADKKQIAANIADAVECGRIEPLKALAAIKAMESIVKYLTDKSEKNKLQILAVQLQGHITDAASKQPEKKFGMYGATFTKTEVGTHYDWSKCNDPKLIELELAAKNASESFKAYQEFLKNVPTKGLEVANSETGEVYTVYPPAKSSTSTVSVSFK